MRHFLNNWDISTEDLFVPSTYQPVGVTVNIHQHLIELFGRWNIRMDEKDREQKTERNHCDHRLHVIKNILL